MFHLRQQPRSADGPLTNLYDRPAHEMALGHTELAAHIFVLLHRTKTLLVANRHLRFQYEIN